MQIDPSTPNYQKLGLHLVSLIPFSICDILSTGLGFLASKVNAAEINRKAATLSKFGIDIASFNAKVAYIAYSIALSPEKQQEILKCEQRAVKDWWEKLNNVVSKVGPAIEDKFVKRYKVSDSPQYMLGHIEAQKMLVGMIYTGKADVSDVGAISICEMLSAYVCKEVHAYMLGPDGKGAIAGLANEVFGEVMDAKEEGGAEAGENTDANKGVDTAGEDAPGCSACCVVM